MRAQYGERGEERRRRCWESMNVSDITKERLSESILALQAFLHARQYAALFLNGTRVALCLLRHHPEELYHYSITTALPGSLSP